MTTVPELPAVLMAHDNARKTHDRRVIVTDPDLGAVTVRWAMGRAKPWRCRACGPMARAECAHTFSAGLVLAEALLGLTRVAELQPERNTR